MMQHLIDKSHSITEFDPLNEHWNYMLAFLNVKNKKTKKTYVHCNYAPIQQSTFNDWVLMTS